MNAGTLSAIEAIIGGIYTMMILGRTSDDKGTQLEELTKRLLAGLGYRNITTNYIGPGGEEIDISADYSLPGIGHSQTRRLICECKAYKSAIDTTNWLKFLGKVFLEESRRDEEVFGCFIALSGVNGNVSGSYDELVTHRTNVSLITGENLLGVVTTLYNLTDITTITRIVSNYTDRVIRMIDICYYNNSVCFIVAFNNNEYTLFRSTGDVLTDEMENIVPLLESSHAIGKYVNLEAEHKAMQRANYIQKAILTEVMCNSGEIDMDSIKSRVQCEEQELEKGLEVLKDRNFICINDSIVSINEDIDSIFVEFFRFFLTGDVFIKALGCPYYDNLINPSIISWIEEIQIGLRITDDMVDVIIDLLKLSPTAFATALYPEQMITQHYHQNIQDERIAAFDRKYFLELLYKGLLNDFNNSQLNKYFYEVRGIREIENNQIIIIKGEKSTLNKGEITNRQGIGQLSDEYGGGYIQILVLDDQPEPWEGTAVLTEKLNNGVENK